MKDSATCIDPEIIRETITLFKGGGVWQAQTTDPETIEIMQTDIIPTPFFDSVPCETVRAKLAGLNPDKDVVIGRRS